MEDVQEERQYSKWEWFFYMIIIPALFATLLGGVLLSLLGVNVTGSVLAWLNRIPVVEKLIPDDATPEMAAARSQSQQMAALEEEVNKEQAASAQLKAAVKEKDAKIADMQKQVEDLQKMMEDKRADDAQRQKQYQDLAKLFTTMSPRNAAAIVENLSLEEAVTVLSVMKPDEKAAILSKMDPKKAADISILLKDTVIHKDDDIAALQKRIDALTKALSESRPGSTSLTGLADTFSQMPPDDAAKILSKLMDTNSSRVVTILAAMSNDKRAQVLSAMARTDEAAAARAANALLR